MGYFDVPKDKIIGGSIVRSLILISVPLVFQNLALIGQQIVDLFWVGQLSSGAVAAIGLSSPIIWLLIALCTKGLFTGTKVFVSQQVGANRQRVARRANFTALVISLFIGVAFGLIAFLNSEFLIDLVMSTHPEYGQSDVSQMAVTYTKTISLGIFIAAMSDVTEAGFIARGDSKATLYINIVAVLANISLDPVFIFGLGPVPTFGIQGAALATVVGYGAGLLLGILLVVFGRSRIYSLDTMKFSLSDAKQIVDIGVPVSIQSAAGNVASLIMIFITYAAAGTPGVTAYTIGTRFSALALLSVKSLSGSAHTIVGQNLGAGNTNRATTTVFTGMKIGIGVLIGIAALQWMAADAIVRIFVPGVEKETLMLSVTFLQIYAIAYPLISVSSLTKAGFNAAERTKTTMVFSLGVKWLLQVPLAIGLGLTLSLGAVGIFWARTLALSIGAIAILVYYIHAERRGMYSRVTESSKAASGN